MKINKKSVGILFIVALFIIFSLSTVVCFGLLIHMDIEDLTQKASVILIGNVTTITTHGGEGMIYREVGIEVERYLKNPLDSSEVFIQVLGGEMGEIGVWVEDQPSFDINERVLVFLRDGGTYQVVGGPQGKYTLTDGLAKSLGHEMTENSLVNKINTLLSTTEISNPSFFKFLSLPSSPLGLIIVFAMIAFWVVYVLDKKKMYRRRE